MNSPLILVLGESNADLVIPLRNQDQRDILGRYSALNIYGGGTAANTAVALARLSANVAFIGTVGDDGFGRWVLEDFKNEGVDIQYINLVQDFFTSLVLAVIHPDGEREIFVWPDSGGAHTKLSPNSIKNKMFEQAAWLHTSGLCLREEPVRSAQLKAMRLAKQEGMSVSLDLNLRLESWELNEAIKDVFDQAVEYSDVVVVNDNLHDH